MPDLNDPADQNPFRDFSPDPAGARLSAGEIRRNGDRLRQRNVTAITAGISALVAILVIPLALSFTGSEPSSIDPIGIDDSTVLPDPTPTPDSEPNEGASDEDLVTEIPADFVLDEGMVDGFVGSEPVSADATGVRGFELCGETPLDSIDPVDRLAVNADGGENFEGRDLRVYRTSVDAGKTAQSLNKAVQSCAEEQDGQWQNSIGPLFNLGEAEFETEFVFTREISDADGNVRASEFIRVIRIRNAILLTRRSGEGVGTTANDQHREIIQPIVEQMCVFSADGCVRKGPPPTPVEKVPGDIPDDFNLIQGWPTEVEDPDRYGTVGPTRDADQLLGGSLDLGSGSCGPFLGDQQTDELFAGHTNVEDFRARALYTFADAEAAVAYTGDVAAQFAACSQAAPPQRGFGFTVEPLDVGGRSFRLVVQSYFSGAPSTFLTTVTVVRLGRAVLIDRWGSEGGQRPDGALNPDQVDNLRGVVADMCLFTEAGC